MMSRQKKKPAAEPVNRRRFGGYSCEPPGYTYRASPLGDEATLREMLIWILETSPEERLGRQVNVVELSAFWKAP
jgi:hypothetical protein